MGQKPKQEIAELNRVEKQVFWSWRACALGGEVCASPQCLAQLVCVIGCHLLPADFM